MKKRLSLTVLAGTILILFSGLFSGCIPAATSGPEGEPSLTGSVRIDGTAQVGNTLQADTDSLGGSGAETYYQWLRDGEPIDDAAGRSYTLVDDDVGVVVSLVVSRKGYTGTKTAETPKVKAADKESGDEPGQPEQGSNLTAKFNFTDSGDTTGKNAVARGISRSLADLESFVTDWAYDESEVGEYVASYTPGEFIINVGKIDLNTAPGGSDTSVKLFQEFSSLVDLVKPMPLEVDIPRRSYDFLKYFQSPYAQITEGDKTGSVQNGPLDQSPRAIFTYQGEAKTIRLVDLDPFSVRDFVFGGGTTMLVYGELFYQDILPTYDTGYSSINAPPNPTSVSAWDGLTIPEDAKTVIFEVRWNLKDIIAQYAGKDGQPDTDDDVFVLRNGFWEDLSLVTRIE